MSRKRRKSKPVRRPQSCADCGTVFMSEDSFLFCDKCAAEREPDKDEDKRPAKKKWDNSSIINRLVDHDEKKEEQKWRPKFRRS